MVSEEIKKVIPILGILFFLNVLAWISVYDLRPQGLEVTFFDVGQGDAIFIETPEGHQILIDGGPNSSILEKLGDRMSVGDRTIDLIILSHPESDHMTGLIETLKKYKIENILWTGVLRDNPEFDVWQDLIEKEEANVFLGRDGRKIIAGKTEIKILHPFEDLSGQKFKDSNNSSLVVKLVFNKNSFLFTGDIYKSIEKELAGKADIDSDVLKISHHGSKTSTAEEFVSAVSPELAVISAGRDNSYGHPHKATLDTLNKFGITILRTDEMGDISIISDGSNLQIK